MAVDRQAGTAGRERVEELLTEAGRLFEDRLWDEPTSEGARELLLSRHGLQEKVIRAFGVGYAPVGPSLLLDHLRGLGYTDDELVAAGLANRSDRGRVHAHFRSRVMFPVRDVEGQILGFSGLGMHLGPSWPLWVPSPETEAYRRSEAVFGIDRAVRKIASSKTAVVMRDSVEVLQAHQARKTNAVTVHSSRVTWSQRELLAAGVQGGTAALRLDLPPSIPADPRDMPDPEPVRPPPAPEPREPPPHLSLKRLAIVIATSVAAVNLWTGAPLIAIWVGSQAQSGQVLSLRGVFVVLVVLSALVFVLGQALAWLSFRYDVLTGRPPIAGETSPWHRAKRGDRVQDIRMRFGVSAPEKVVATSVVIALIALEIWFFFYAGSPFAE